jgi:hypothetical protein
MTDEQKQTLDEITKWFFDRGFVLHFKQEDEMIWADLGGLTSGRVIAPLYGGGESQLEAACSAKSRYEQEE